MCVCLLLAGSWLLTGRTTKLARVLLLDRATRPTTPPARQHTSLALNLPSARSCSLAVMSGFIAWLKGPTMEDRPSNLPNRTPSMQLEESLRPSLSTADEWRPLAPLLLLFPCRVSRLVQPSVQRRPAVEGSEEIRKGQRPTRLDPTTHIPTENCR